MPLFRRRERIIRPGQVKVEVSFSYSCKLFDQLRGLVKPYLETARIDESLGDASPKYRLQGRSWYHWNEHWSRLHRTQIGQNFPLQVVASCVLPRQQLGITEAAASTALLLAAAVFTCLLNQFPNHSLLVMSMHMRINVCIPDSITAR